MTPELKKNIIRILGGSLLLTVFSQWSIPTEPVPFTLQTIAVTYLGLAFHPSNAFLSVVIWLLAGTSGLPVFAEGASGLEVMLGPTGGYLIGFLPAVLIMAIPLEMSGVRRPDTLFLVGMAGTLVILFSGYLRLAVDIGSEQAWLLGVKPFILPGMLKVVIALVLYQVWIRINPSAK